MHVREGLPYPLGATLTPEGVNFAVFSAHATRIDVCFFDSPDGPETGSVTLGACTDQIHHGLVVGLTKGQLYGLRAHGPFAPQLGHRFNAKRLLVDPYARALAGHVDHEHNLRGHTLERARSSSRIRVSEPPRSVRAHHPGTHLPRGEEVLDEHDTAPFVPKCVVVDDAFDWGNDEPPRVRWSDSVIYEVHVKGFTARHPLIPRDLRGTYLGLAHPAAISHLRELGVTAVELLPVQHHVDEPFLLHRGLTNYWGYQTLGWCAPDARFSPASMGERGGQVIAFKQMVKALHAAGIEVILDVVYNHGCEGDPNGPTLSLRGLDNAIYFRLASDKRRYDDFTGCGNTLDLRHPMVLRMVMDSLRYWTSEMHVDGFRFDLASALGRTDRGFEIAAPFFAALAQDPVLARVKLIAEPWDLGDGGYRVGGFPLGFSEWNGKFRDGVRKFWAGIDPFPRELAYRLTGSSDLYEMGGRGTRASINFVTCHDGFTLADLVTYERKHNEANGEENRDGSDHNDAWNCGVEGPTNDADIRLLRARQMRNLLATLILSAGVPMLLAGDELGHSQRGNNNAYCQDNELTWLDWELNAEQRELMAFVRSLLALRRAHPSLRRARHYRGVPTEPHCRKDLAWIRPDGAEMQSADWERPCRTFGALVDGDDPVLIIVNGERAAATFRLPPCDGVSRWRFGLSTRIPDDFAGVVASPGSLVSLLPLDMCVLVSHSAILPTR